MNLKTTTSVKTIGICAPSARFDPEHFNNGLQVLRNEGFNTVIPERIFGRKRYLAGEDQYRAEVINSLYADPDVDCIMCARGGFGAMRILNYLDWNLIKDQPKLFVGFSDNSALLINLINKAQQVVVHGPTVVSLALAKRRTINSVVAAVRGESAKTIFVEKAASLRTGQSTGLLKGGNLSTLSHLMGTPYQPSFLNSILFIEDINEKAYQIDRMLSQMKMAGVFAGLKGVVVGEFHGSDHPSYIEETLLEIFDDPKIPILSNIESGHGEENLSLHMGVTVRLDAEKQTIEWLDK